jgi:hypothetical protein
MKWIHVIAGTLSILTGFVALCVAKGSPLHKRSGIVFAIAMLVMTSTGALLAAMKPERGSMLAGLLAFYLVCTSLLTVRRTVPESRAWLIGFMGMALTLGVVGYAFTYLAMTSANGRLDHLPPQPIFLFGTVALLGAALDARLLIANGIAGSHRIARHLWRMGFALWMATTSLFLGQPTIFPDFLRERMGLRAIPVLFVVAMIVYWLWRTLRTKKRPVPARA